MDRLKELLQQLRLLQQINDIEYNKLTTEEVNDISLLFVDPKYKSFVKLQNNIIIDLQNKYFKEGEKFEEFLGIKWARQLIEMSQIQVKNTYFKSIKPKRNDESKTTPIPEDFESVPDGLPIQG